MIKQWISNIKIAYYVMCSSVCMCACSSLCYRFYTWNCFVLYWVYFVYPYTSLLYPFMSQGESCLDRQLCYLILHNFYLWWWLVILLTLFHSCPFSSFRTKIIESKLKSIHFEALEITFPVITPFYSDESIRFSYFG